MPRLEKAKTIVYSDDLSTGTVTLGDIENWVRMAKENAVPPSAQVRSMFEMRPQSMEMTTLLLVVDNEKLVPPKPRGALMEDAQGVIGHLFPHHEDGGLFPAPKQHYPNGAR